MPIDPNIITQGLAQFQKPPDPIERYARIQALKNGATQAQIQQLQLTAGTQENQQRQIAIDSDAAGRKLFASGGDPTDSQILSTYGAAQGSAILKNRLEARTAQANLQKTKAEVAGHEQDYFGALASAVKNAKYDPQALDMAFEDAERAGYGQHVAQLRQVVTQNPDALPQMLDQLIQASPKQRELGNSAQTAAAATSRADSAAAEVKLNQEAQPGKLANTAADVAKKQTEAAASQLAAAAAQGPDALARAMSAWQVQAPAIAAKFQDAKVPADFARIGMSADQQVTTTEAARHNKVEEAQGAQRTAIERAGQALREKTFNATIGAGLDANGRPLPADEMLAQAKADPVAVAIADYREKPPSGGVRGGGTSPLMRKVQLISGNTYDDKLYDSRHKTALDYTPAGKEGTNLKAADTALAHLDAISQAGRALDNGDIQALNKLANYLGTQTGSDAQTIYNAIVGLVAPEISKATIGAVGGEGERHETAKTYADFLNTKTREGAIGATAALLGKRVEKSLHAYESEMGKPLAWKLSEESQGVYDRYSGKATNTAPGAKPPLESFWKK